MFNIVLKTLPKKFQQDKTFLLLALERNYHLLKELSADYLNDYEIAHTLLQKNGKSLEYFSEDIRNHESLTLLAIKDEP